MAGSLLISNQIGGKSPIRVPKGSGLDAEKDRNCIKLLTLFSLKLRSPCN